MNVLQILFFLEVSAGGWLVPDVLTTLPHANHLEVLLQFGRLVERVTVIRTMHPKNDVLIDDKLFASSDL